MPSIVAYRKHIDSLRTVELKLPHDGPTALGSELATIAGVTYVALPDGVTLPAQPAEIAPSVETVALTDELRESIKAASPLSRLIGDQMIEKIRARYTIDDELYLARIGVGASSGLYEPTASEMQEMVVYGSFVESVRQWGRAERAKVGL